MHKQSIEKMYFIQITMVRLSIQFSLTSTATMESFLPQEKVELLYASSIDEGRMVLGAEAEDGVFFHV